MIDTNKPFGVSPPIPAPPGGQIHLGWGSAPPLRNEPEIPGPWLAPSERLLAPPIPDQHAHIGMPTDLPILPSHPFPYPPQPTGAVSGGF